MRKSDSSTLWIEKGYALFALEGPEGVQVEKLARLLDRNKSSFYHHFGDRDLFFSELIQHHYRIVDQFCLESSGLNKFYPDWLELLVKYKLSTFMQMQLRKRNEDPLFREVFNRVRTQTEKNLLPLWAAYVNIPNNQTLAWTLWDILRDLVFMRITPQHFTLDSLLSLVREFAIVIEMVRKLAQIQGVSTGQAFRNL